MTSCGKDAYASVRLTNSIEAEDVKPSPALRLQLVPWLTDFGSLLLSLLCIVAVIALLMLYDGKPLPQWVSVFRLG